MSPPPGTPSDGRPASQGTIAIHDDKNGKHRIVPLPRSLESPLKHFLEKLRDRHLQDLAVGNGDDPRKPLFPPPNLKIP